MNIIKIVEGVKLVVALTPALIDAIQTVERALPQSGQGASKLALVRSMLEGVFNAYTEAVDSFEDIWPALNKVITMTVAAFNASGAFKK